MSFLRTVAIPLAKIAAAGLVLLFLLVGLVGYFSDPPLPVYSARIVDLSSIDPRNYEIPPYDPNLRWITHPRAGVALWSPETRSFIVFPLAEGNDDPFDPDWLGFWPGELPKPTSALVSAFRAGCHIGCRTSQVSSIDVWVSAETPSVGRIRVTYEGQGQAIEYASGDEYLF